MKTLHAAAKMFPEQGYTNTTVRGIAEAAGVNVSSRVKVMGSKENILLELVAYVLESQFGGWLTMEKKVDAFLTTTFRVYRVPDEKIQEAIRFVSRFEYPRLARETIDSTLTYLEGKLP